MFYKTIKFNVILITVCILVCPRHTAASAENEPYKQAGALISLADKQWFDHHSTVRIYVSPHYPPFEFQENNSYKGIAVDYLHEVSRRLDIQFQIVSGLDFAQAMEDIKTGSSVDMVLMATPTPERKKNILFTRSYLSFPLVIFTRKDADFISGLRDLSGNIIVVEKGHHIAGWLRRDIPNVRILEVSDTAMALEDLSVGKANAYVGNLAVGSFLIDKKGLTNIKIAAPTQYATDDLSMAVRKDWPELATAINKAFDSMTEDENRAIRQRWLAVRYEYGISVKDITMWVALIAGLSAMIILVIRLVFKHRAEAGLRSEVALRQASEQKVRALLDKTFELIGMLTPEGTIIEINRTALEFAGITRESVVGKPLWETPWWSYSADVMTQLRQAIQAAASGSIMRFQTAHPARDGEMHPVDFSLNPVLDERNNVQYLVAEGYDITARKEDAETIHRLNAELSATLQAIPDLLFELDQNGTYINIWARDQSLLASQKELLLGHTITEMLAPDAAETVMASIIEADQRGSSFGKVIRIDLPGGARWFELSTSKKAIPDQRSGRFIMLSRDISERKQAEEALRISEEKFRKVFLTSADSININRLEDGRYVSINQGFTAMTGYTEDEVIGKTSLELNIWVDPADRQKLVEGLRKHGEVRNYETRFLAKNGRIIVGLMSATIIEIDLVQYNVNITRDITLSKSHEAEIERLNRLYAVLSHVNQTVVRVLSREELFRKVCSILVEFGGLKMAWIGRHDPATHKVTVVAQHGDSTGYLNDICVYADDRPEGCGPTGTALKDGMPFISNDFHNDPRTLPWRKAAALTSWHAAAGFPIHFGNEVCYALTVYAQEKNFFGDREVSLLDEVASTVSFGLDTLENEAKRMENEKRYRMLFESMTTGFALHEVICDKRGMPFDYRFLEVNPAFEKQTGLKASDIIGKTVLEVLPGIERSWIEVYGKVAQSGESASFKNFSAELERHFDIMAYCPQPGRFAAIITDITEKQKLEEQLRQTQKLESVGTLAGGIAHDFNNLLQGAFGYISLAKMTGHDREKSLAALEEAEKALHMSVKLTNQLLTFSKGGRPVKKIISLLPVIENAARFALSGSRTDFRVAANDGLWQVNADDGQISQVIQNIVLNADQAMPGGGRIEITVRNAQAPSQELAKGLDKGKYVQIAIQDTGIGISKQNLGKIFDPYFTTKETGSGLGLATSYSIIKNHNGVIDVKSEVGKGTVFIIYLPAAAVAKRTEKAISAAVTPVRMGRVLVMDDEPVILDVAGKLIRALGHGAAFASQGKEAIEKYLEAKESGQPFDIVILDLTIRGGMGGTETLKKLLEIDSHVKAIVSSGYSNDAAVARHQVHGFKAFLKKPYNIEDLRETLNRLLIS